MRIRKDIATLDEKSSDILSLIAAVAIMKDPSTKQQTWAEWAYIHGAIGGGQNKCQHNNWFFLPWHRMYVYYFEQHVAKIAKNPDFALPYWDWTKHPTVPNFFWNPPLSNPTRTVKKGELIPQVSYDKYVSPTVIANLLEIATFPTFGGTVIGSGGLESTPHNFIHNWIGGDMSTWGSPTDPIFWMHHCNCDRLYSAWISKHAGKLPSDSSWNNKEFPDFFGQGMKVSETSRTDGPPLNYIYDRLTPGVGTEVTPSPELIAVEGPVVKVGNVVGAAVVFTISVDGPVAAAIRRITAGAVDPRASGVTIEFQGIKVPTNQNVQVSVFINAPNPRPDLPVSDPHYVTSFTFLHGKHGGEAKKDDHGMAKQVGHDDSTVTRLLDATHTLNRLYAATGFSSGEPLKVQIVAAPLFPDRADQWRGTVQELSPAQVRISAVLPKR